MRYKYIMYPHAVERIQNGGLVERIDACLGSDEGPDMYGHISNSDVRDYIGDLAERGFLKTLPKDTAQGFKDGLQRLYGDERGHTWKVHRGDQVTEETTESSDILLLAGWLPSFVLTPDELWDYERFGFSSITDFTGSVGAYMVMRNHERHPMREGMKWTTDHNGQLIETDVTGDQHYDFKVWQTDVTPYKTEDPLGNVVSFRPECREDRRGISSHHSVEGSFLALLLKYAEQHEIPSAMLQDNAQPLIAYTKSLGQRSGATTEHLMGGRDDFGVRMNFIGHDLPMTRVDEQLKPSREGGDAFASTSGDHSYQVCVGPEKELVFLNPSTGSSEPRLAARFLPTELDSLLQGVMYQTAMGIGRTPASELIRALEFRYSQEGQAFLEETKHT